MASMSDVGVQQLVPLLMVKSINASVRFYVDALGFTMTKTWEPQGKLSWCWLEHGTAPLMLQEFGSDGKHRSGGDGPVGFGVGLHFTCRDALAFYHVVTERGVAVTRPFVGNGMWIASLADPDGYKLHFRSATDLPEETVYEGRGRR